MTAIRRFFQNNLFVQVPPQQQAAFNQDRALRNSFRFMLLPFFNILTQLGCYVIYLHIYPAAYPQRPRLDPNMFTVLTLLYLAANIAVILRFKKLRSMPIDAAFTARANRLVLVFLVFYVVFEGVETCMEVQISGNIYRFLATFFVVAFLPILPRLQKLLYLAGYTLVAEAGFFVLVRQGYEDTNQYRAIVLLFFVVCAVLSSATHSATIKSFSLRQELLEANRRLQALSVTDPLTGIANRRAFDEYIHRVWMDCRRNGGTLHAIMMDIDWFKPYNDTYGHQKGDECLQRVAECIQQGFRRAGDMVARYGGEEFVVLLPYSTDEGVLKLAAAVRSAIEGMDIHHPYPASFGHITVSIGVASMRPTAGDAGYAALVKLADDALYHAKNTGRNRVHMAGSEVQTA